jgi:hypothetical protein
MTQDDRKNQTNSPGLYEQFAKIVNPEVQKMMSNSVSGGTYDELFQKASNSILKRLGLLSPTSGLTTPENQIDPYRILAANGSKNTSVFDAVEAHVQQTNSFNPYNETQQPNDPEDREEHKRTQHLAILEANQMFDALLQENDFQLEPLTNNERAAYTSHMLGKPQDQRAALAKKLVNRDLKALEDLNLINALYAGFDPEAAQAESTGSIALDSDFISKLRGSESSGKTSAEYKDKKGNRFVGLDQIGSPRLKDFNRATGNNYTQKELKGDATKQEEVASWHYNNHADNIKKQGLDRFIGQIDPKSGAEITLSGMLAVAHLGGFGGLQKYLTDQAYTAKDELGTSLSKYMKKFSGLSVEGESSMPLPPRRPESME